MTRIGSPAGIVAASGADQWRHLMTMLETRAPRPTLLRRLRRAFAIYRRERLEAERTGNRGLASLLFEPLPRDGRFWPDA
jgi:hypothetical protein